jgi:hypothetical protein
MVADELHVELVINQTMLDQARCLLYQCYIQKLGWMFPQDNPSGLSFRMIEQGCILVDDYDKKSVWFLLFLRQHPIGTMRICYPDDDNTLEIERYPSAKCVASRLLFSGDHHCWVELNREAILPEYMFNQQALLILLQALLRYCYNNKLSVLTSCYFQEWHDIYSSIGFDNLEDAQFKYFDQDEKDVEIFFVKTSKLKKILVNIDVFLSKMRGCYVMFPNYNCLE